MSKKTALVGGVAILGVAGLISKVIGMFFRIPLTNLIGSGGLGLYQAVYPTYSLLLTISTAGIPVAISRLVSESVTMGKRKNALAILRTALVLLTGIGLLFTLLMLSFSGQLASRMGDAEAQAGFIAIAPAVVLVTVMSAFRGYLQGHSDMRPTAVSQLIEQVAKVALSLPLSVMGLNRGGVAMAAAGALLGITLGEGLALIFMMIAFTVNQRRHAAEIAEDAAETEGFGALARKLVRIAVPITIGSSIVPLASYIDSAMIRLRLMEAGFAVEQARSLYGLLSGSALSLINVPTVLATAVCIGLVPAISAARIKKRTEEVHELSRLGLRLGSLIGLPCGVGMSMLSTEIIRLLYPSLPENEILVTGRILSLSALTIFFFTQVQATTGILQGVGLQRIPMYSLVAGVVCKITLNYILIAIPSVNIYGAPVASITCYTVSMLINFIWVVQKVGMKMDWKGILLRPAAATLGMALTVEAYRRLTGMTSRLDVLIAIGAAVVVYAALVFALGALRREDMEMIPGGRKIERLMVKMKFWK